MQPRDDGHWSITLDLAPGRYQYKFVVDEHWLPDLNAHENVPNEHGTLNSVIEVHNPSQSTKRTARSHVRARRPLQRQCLRNGVSGACRSLLWQLESAAFSDASETRLREHS